MLIFFFYSSKGIETLNCHYDLRECKLLAIDSNFSINILDHTSWQRIYLDASIV